MLHERLSFSPVPDTEQAKAYEVLISAFTNDPVERWLYPELPQYLAHFPQFLATFGGAAFDAGTVWRLGNFALSPSGCPPKCERTAT